MRGTSRKIAVIVIALLTLALVGVVIFVVIQTQQNQAPATSSASGFGPTATKDLYPFVQKAFVNLGCSAIFDQNSLAFYSRPEYTQLNAFKVKNVVDLPSTPLNNPLNCLVISQDNKTLTFSFHGYDQNSVIDDSFQTLYDRINHVTLKTILRQEATNGSTYFFGTDFNDQTVCRSNLFNPQNDFEFITLSYTGFGNCNDILPFARQLNIVMSLIVRNVLAEAEQNLATSK